MSGSALQGSASPSGVGNGSGDVATVSSGEEVSERHTFPEGYRRMFLAAAEAFAERGFHATSTRDIAARAGLSPAAVYVHFSSKEELLFQIIRIGHDLAIEVLEEAAAADAAPPARLRTVISTFTGWQMLRYRSAWVVQYGLDALSPEHLETVNAQRARIDHFVRGLIQDGVDSGDFHVEDVRVAGLAILSLCLDIIRWYHPDMPVTPEELGPSYGDIALRIVGYPGV